MCNMLVHQMQTNTNTHTHTPPRSIQTIQQQRICILIALHICIFFQEEKRFSKYKFKLIEKCNSKDEGKQCGVLILRIISSNSLITSSSITLLCKRISKNALQLLKMMKLAHSIKSAKKLVVKRALITIKLYFVLK